jgi:ABC-type transport system involved in multi-copper enzyme maturation permease subunit
MFYQLKSEFRKLLSIRSTYILLSIALVIVGLAAYFGTSGETYEKAVCQSSGEVLYTRDYTDERLQQAGPEEICGGNVTITAETTKDLHKERLLFGLQETVPIVVTFVSIILVLLVAHEFRYNTINYTLTISSSRSKVLLAKLVVAVLFTLLTTLLAVGVSLAVTSAAISLKDLTLPAQDYNWLYVVSRHLVYALGYTLFAVGVAVLVRNLTVAVAAVFIFPILDEIAGLLLAIRDIEPTKALPFSALGRFGNVTLDVAPGMADEAAEFASVSATLPATALGALTVFAVYLVALWAITWYLFLRRDAN